MDLTVQSNAVKLFTRIADSASPTETVVPFVPQKPEFTAVEPKSPLPRLSPTAAEISPDTIAAFLTELKNEPRLDMHTVLIVKDGNIVCDAAYGDYTTKVWRLSHSECKSVTSLAVGLLIGDGTLSLDDRVTPLLSAKLGILLRAAHPGLTVRHLLTMSSGILFNEAGTVTDGDWLRSFFESVPKFPFGKRFEYNSMNSYILSEIVREKSGRTMSEFLSERLFAPLGIENFYWEKSSSGADCGGFGLYMLPEDTAKLGMLVMNGGVYGGKRLISADYIKEALTPAFYPEGNGDYSYGFHIWLGKSVNSFLFNGMFGQNLLGYPDNGVIIVANGAVGETFQQGPFYEIANRFFGKTLAPCGGRKSEKSLRAALKSIAPQPVQHRHRLFRRLEALDGVKIILNGGEPSPAGLMPIILSVVRNSYTSGITELAFSFGHHRLFLNVTESGVSTVFPVGFGETLRSQFEMNGEIFETAVSGRLAENEDGETVLVLRFSFTELSNARIIKLIFHRDLSVTARFSELPDEEFLGGLIESYADSLPLKLLGGKMKALLDSDLLRYRTRAVFEPELSGKMIISGKE